MGMVEKTGTGYRIDGYRMDLIKRYMKLLFIENDSKVLIG